MIQLSFFMFFYTPIFSLVLYHLFVPSVSIIQTSPS